MRHKDLEDSAWYCLGDLVRPSQRKTIRDALWAKGVRKYKDLCAMKEDDFKSLPFVDDTLHAKVKAHLEGYGLRFGMTEDEMLVYMDEEYLAEHPEEAEIVVVNAPTDGVDADEKETDETPQPNPDTVTEGIASNIEELMAVEPASATGKDMSEGQATEEHYYCERERDDFVEQRVKAANQHGDLDPLPLPVWDGDGVRGEAMRLRDLTDPRCINSNDMEWIRVRLMEAALSHLPWYYRFLPARQQVLKAEEYFNVLFDNYMDGLVERIVAYRRSLFEEEKAKVAEENRDRETARKAITSNAKRDFSLILEAQEKTDFTAEEFKKALLGEAQGVRRRPAIVSRTVVSDGWA